MPEAADLRVRDILADATAQLVEAGSASPRLDAELLLGEVLRAGRADLVLRATDSVSLADQERFAALVARRRAHEPVAYILGWRAFRWITLAVDRRVLIPRPESELLVEAALEAPEGARVIDVGTGSGAVALALAHERPDLTVLASDTSEDALALARFNAARLELEVEFVRASLLEGVPGPFDAVVANLPYVAAPAPLPPDVVEYEPAEALFGGPDGLDLIRGLVGQIDGVKLVALEVGEGQAPAVAELLRGAGFAEVSVRRDLAGIERAVVGRR